MKKIILIIIASLMLCNIGFAEMRLIEEKKIKGGTFTQFIQTVCIDGYKFVIINKRGENDSSSIVQFMIQNNMSGSPYPQEC